MYKGGVKPERSDLLTRQYLYFCTSKASKVSTGGSTDELHMAEAVVQVRPLSIRHHTSPYVTIREHT
jgi:hypothetical protein